MHESKLRYPKWQNPCVDAVMELDPSKLLERVTVAETAIYERLRELQTSSDRAEERLAINDAMKTLRIITRDRLNPSSMQSGLSMCSIHLRECEEKLTALLASLNGNLYERFKVTEALSFIQQAREGVSDGQAASSGPDSELLPTCIGLTSREILSYVKKRDQNEGSEK